MTDLMDVAVKVQTLPSFAYELSNEGRPSQDRLFQTMAFTGLCQKVTFPKVKFMNRKIKRVIFFRKVHFTNFTKNKLVHRFLQIRKYGRLSVVTAICP